MENILKGNRNSLESVRRKKCLVWKQSPALRLAGRDKKFVLYHAVFAAGACDLCL